jgi:hypothetical protein
MLAESTAYLPNDSQPISIQITTEVGGTALIGATDISQGLIHRSVLSLIILMTAMFRSRNNNLKTKGSKWGDWYMLCF